MMSAGRGFGPARLCLDNRIQGEVTVRVSLISVVAFLAVACPASAYTVGGELIDEHPAANFANSFAGITDPRAQIVGVGAEVVNVDQIHEAYDPLAKAKYSYKKATAHCWIQNVIKQKVAGMKITYHWSWWTSGSRRNTIKNWYRDTVVPADLKYGWGYDGSYNAGGSGGIGKVWVEHYVVSQFSWLGSASALIQSDMVMWPNGGAVNYCTIG